MLSPEKHKEIQQSVRRVGHTSVNDLDEADREQVTESAMAPLVISSEPRDPQSQGI